MLKILHGGIAISGVRRHGSQGDLDQFARLLCRHDFISGGGEQALHHIPTLMRWAACDDLVKDGTQQIDVAGRSHFIERSGCHFGCHIGRRTTHACFDTQRPRTGLITERQGEAPVHDEYFTVPAEHRVFGLEVAMNHAA